MIPLRYNIRNLMVRRSTSLATLVGIALVVFVLAAAMMLTAGIERTMAASGAPDHAVVLRKGSDVELQSSIQNQSVGLILSAPGVKVDDSGSPVGGGEILVVIAQEKVGSDGQVSNIQVRGVAANIAKYRPEVRMIAGRPARPGTDEVVIGNRIRGRFQGVQLGETFELNKNRPVKVVGVFDAGGSTFESEVWADVETVRSAFGRDGVVSSVTAVLESPSKYDAFSAMIEHDKQLGLEAMREREYYEKQSEGTTMFVSILGWVISFFFIVAAIIGAFITMNTAVAHRRKEIGTMRALGFSRSAILISFVIECLFLSVSGAVLGIVAAFGMSFVKFSMMNFATWSEIVFTFQMTGSVIITAVVVGGVMGLLGGFIPAFKASRLKPIEALRA